MSLINKKFNLMVSPGTVYMALYSLEREGLIKSKNHNNSRKRAYILTCRGEEFMESFLSLRESVKLVVSKIFDEGRHINCKRV